MVNRRSSTLILMSTAHGMNHFYQLLIPIIITPIQSDYGLSTFLAGVIISIYSLSYALFQTPFGFFSKALGRKNTVIIGLVIASAAFLILGFVKDLTLFAITLFIAGIGGSTYHPNGMPLLSEFYEANRGQAAGFHQTGGSLGSVIAPLVIGPLAVLLNWRLTITVLAVPGFILSVVLWLLLKEPPKPIITSPAAQEATAARANVKLYRSSLIFIGAAAIYTVGVRATDSLGVLYLQSGRGITNLVEASFLFSLFKLPGLFSAPICGKLSDIVGRKKALTVLVGIEAVSLYALTIVSNSLVALPIIIFGFASFGLLAISDAYLADITPAAYMTALFGLNFTLTFFTQVVIPPLYGVLVDTTKSFAIGFVILSLIIPFSLPILWKVKEPQTLNIQK